MRSLKQLQTGFQALKELGVTKIALYFIYQAGVRSGFYRLLTPTRKTNSILLREDTVFWVKPKNTPFTIPTTDNLLHWEGSIKSEILGEANKIVNDRFRFFGDQYDDLNFIQTYPLRHWTEIQDDPKGTSDLKYFWEPARFCWVFPLGTAYLLTRNEKYPTAFWKHFNEFLENNPVNMGVNWISGQEIALRIITFSFALQVFWQAETSTKLNMEKLVRSIFQHADRIPKTLLYARAQNNNHLISEAIGLMIAGSILPPTKKTSKWFKLGWRTLNNALMKQIDDDGCYVQHSTNYHRMMLYLALLGDSVSRKEGISLQENVLKKLEKATEWLIARYDDLSGKVPNLGHNDGSNILNLAGRDYSDYRPVLEAASRAFAKARYLDTGPWEVLCTWLGIHDPKQSFTQEKVRKIRRAHQRIGSKRSWGSLRAATFFDRPAHADQLHTELWWQGTNIAMDAGTYLYTAPEPWNNALANTPIHNTISINNLNQMRKAGRFLWLQWASARIIQVESKENSITGEHYGFNNAGYTHRRKLHQVDENRWIVTDYMLPTCRNIHTTLIALHWLLPDGKWDLKHRTLRLTTPSCNVELTFHIENPEQCTPNTQIIRTGEVKTGKQDHLPIFGWYSPTYGCKIPSVSIRVLCMTNGTLTLRSEWKITRI